MDLAGPLRLPAKEWYQLQGELLFTVLVFVPYSAAMIMRHAALGPLPLHDVALLEILTAWQQEPEE